MTRYGWIIETGSLLSNGTYIWEQIKRIIYKDREKAIEARNQYLKAYPKTEKDMFAVKARIAPVYLNEIEFEEII